MSHDRTEQQDREHQRDARVRSMEAARPPAQVEGYLLDRHLGSGAFGQVWSATDRTTGRRVAIKFYNRRSVGDIEPLAREVQKLVVLSADRHVVQLLDVGWEADPPWFVMEYLPQGSLEDLLRRRHSLPVDQALELFEEIAAGLMHLHGKGVLHCDLKPGNVLLDNDDKPRLADFGQSRLSDEATPSLGTLFYMAPEQADLEATPDARWDVYALGALLYVMLTGKPPYFDDTLTSEIEASGDVRSRLATYRRAITAAGQPRRHRQVPGVDRALAEIIDRCIAIDPRRRYASVQSVLLALRQRRDAIARRPLLLLGLVGPLLLAGIAGLFGWTAYRRAVYDTDHAVMSRAVESNLFAARLAARSAAEQLDQYFRAAEKLATDRSFLGDFRAALADETLGRLRRELADPARNVDPVLQPQREQFRNHPLRLALQFHLRQMRGELPLPQVNSWFVYDLYGNQLASIFGGEKATGANESPDRADLRNTIGLNYSWRTYFTGLERDLYQDVPGAPAEFLVDPNPEKRVHIDQSNLSAVFISEATGTWKVAFSTPVRDGNQIVGVVGLTVEMGNFVDFQAGAHQYALMYDSRAGDHTGTILEHPLLDRLRNGGGRPDPSLAGRRLLHPPDRTTSFEDPLGQAPGGEEYRGRAIASEAPVEFTEMRTDRETGGRLTARRDSGLRIVVVEDYDSVVEPAHALGRRLSWLGLVAALFLLGVALIMWLLVVRLMRQTSRQLARAFTSMGNATPGSSFGSIPATSGGAAAHPDGELPGQGTTRAGRETELGR